MIDSIEALEAIYGLPHERAVRKQIGFLNEDYQAMVRLSPLVIVSSVGADGLDNSPRGDAPGFVRIIDQNTLALPDRPGNNRLDTLENILVNPAVGLLFLVPGMNHCSMGPAADQFDLLGPLVQWVEQGVAPQAVVASVRGAGNAGGVNTELPADWSPKRTRPLCAYPQYAHYKGTGNPEDASNFSCR